MGRHGLFRRGHHRGFERRRHSRLDLTAPRPQHRRGFGYPADMPITTAKAAISAEPSPSRSSCSAS
jgi:hypothetical protein